MENAYYDIYSKLYKDYEEEIFFHLRRPPFREDQYLRIIKRTIEEVDTGNRLRPDAKYFLIVNFHHLIVLPVLERRYSQYGRSYEPRYIPDRKFSEDIREDIQTIISNTETQLGEQDISGHQIMRTIDRLWRELKTTKLEIWG